MRIVFCNMVILKAFHDPWMSFEKSKETPSFPCDFRDQMQQLAECWSTHAAHLNACSLTTSQCRLSSGSRMILLKGGTILFLDTVTQRIDTTLWWFSSRHPTHMDHLSLKPPWSSNTRVSWLHAVLSCTVLLRNWPFLYWLAWSCFPSVATDLFFWGIQGCKNERSGGDTLQSLQDTDSGPFLTYVVYKSWKRPSMQVKSAGSAFASSAWKVHVRCCGWDLRLVAS